MSDYSIRVSLQGALQDFIRSSGFTCVHLEALIRDFVGLLAAYREEDALLFPEVFVFSSAQDLPALNPSSYLITIGSTRLVDHSASSILKNCAPLAAHGWAIFVVKDGTEIRFGLFRSVRHALATAAEESMQGLGIDAPVILIRNCGHLAVELKSTVEPRFTAALTTTPAQPSRLEADVSRFVEVVSANAKEALSFKSYLQRLLTATLQKCHGTLLAVIENTGNPTDPSLADGVWPVPPLPLAEWHARARSTGTADDLAELQAGEALLAGMIDSDGVVVFGTDGSILAYRVFLRANEAEKSVIPERGGGRRRTFELMKIRTQTIFKCVFFKSQDGETKCEGSI